MRDLTRILKLAHGYDQELPDAPRRFDLPKGADLASWIDHTALKAETTPEQIKQLCDEAKQFRFATVCVNPGYVPLARGLLRNSGVGICSVVAFPLGANLPEYKALETRGVIEMGATEIDMVINIGALKSGSYELVLQEIEAVVREAHEKNVHVKVILEMALLNRREKIIGCLLCEEANADFVKTSTGFSSGGATVEDVELMRCVVSESMGVKAAGGIRTLADAHAMIRAGANRIGASAGVSIMNEAVLS